MKRLLVRAASVATSSTLLPIATGVIVMIVTWRRRERLLKSLA